MVRRLTVLFLITGSLTASGCMLPDYYHPGGYSSTSSKRLEESQVAWPEDGLSLPRSPFRLVADSYRSGSRSQPDAFGDGADDSSASSRIANHRGRFAAH